MKTLFIHPVLIALFLTGLCPARGQNTFRVHSHNDYQQSVPFWTAYSSGCASIEADLFLKNDTLYVTHAENEIVPGRTLRSLYLEPLAQALEFQLGEDKPLQLLIDLKSEARPTLRALVRELGDYPQLSGSDRVRFIISGNRPKPRDYVNYPDFIHFDYQSLESDSEVDWDRVALISLNFKGFSRWNGLGRLTKADLDRVQQVVERAHAMGKPFRFWGAPDGKTAWKTFTELGVDFVNTDRPVEATQYLSALKGRIATGSQPSPIYRPAFQYDPESRPAKVILLIGDGNGLAQISSAAFANGGDLSLTQLRSIGLVKTASTDDFSTDSAAGGTAMATGEKTHNRAIGVDSLDQPLPNLTEILDRHDMASGLLTTDHITGATPASFYAHRSERGDVKGIAQDLHSSRLSLFMGGGGADFDADWSQSPFVLLRDTSELSTTQAPRVGLFFADTGVASSREGRGPLLPEATRQALDFLNRSGKGFFLMVEGAKIDSYGHSNDVQGIVEEGLDFDRAIAEALRFADADGQTLVLITADHETGGLSLLDGHSRDGALEGSFSTNDHTGIMVPLFAYGPGAEDFQGVYENTEIFHRILKALGIEVP